MNILKFFLKCICSILIVIVAFIEKILTLLAGIANFVGGITFLAGIVLGLIEIKDNGFQVEVLWLPILIAFIGFVLPFVGMSLPIALGILRAKMTDFVFGN